MVQIPPLDDVRRAPLRTDRLTLAPLGVAYAEDFFNAIESCRPYMERFDDAYRYFVSVEMVRAQTVRLKKLWDDGKGAHFVVLLKDAVLGQVSLSEVNVQRESANLSYWIREDAARKGYATEAARAALRWGFGQCKIRRAEASVHTQNVGSQKVLERCGFRLEGTIRESEPLAGAWVGHHVYGLLARDFTS